MENIQRTTGKPFSPAYEKGIHKVALENKNKDYILKDFMGGWVRIWKSIFNTTDTKEINKRDDSQITFEANYKRYLKFRNKLFEDAPISKLYLYNTKDIISLPQDELIHIIKEGLDNEYWYVRKCSAEMIQYIQDDGIKEELIEKGLDDEDVGVKISSARMIQYIQNDDIKEDLYEKLKNIIEKGLVDKNVNVKISSAGMIQYIQNDSIKKELCVKLRDVIEKGLDDENVNVRISSAVMIQYIQDDGIKKELIEKGLDDEDEDVRKISAEMIQYIQDDGIKEELCVKLQYVIRKGLDDAGWYVRKCSAEMIQYIQNDSIKKELYVKLKDVIEKGLNNENVNVRKSSARMIQYIQNITIKKELYEKLKDVIEKGLDDEDWYVRSISAEMIQYIQDENSKEDLYAKLKSVIERGLDNEDVNVRKSSARMIQYIKNDGIKKELIEKGLNNENVNVRKSSARMIQYIQDDNIRKDLIEILKAKGWFEKYNLPKKKSDHSLYKYEGYQRKIYGRNGSEIDKLADDKHQNMLGKVYKRTTSLNPFLLQMKAFENYKTWEEVGLDHIPIETIYRFRVERDKEGNLKNNKISFFAKVYDDTLLNLEYKDLYYTHQKEIEEQKRNILKGLEKLNIDHGDFLSQNICISWLRDKNNKPDFTKAPLLYLIDWDSAKINK